MAGDPPDRYICTICQFVAQDAYQASCCGKVFCKNCLIGLRRNVREFRCPACREQLNSKCFKDTRADQEIRDLHVFCDNRKEGCEWAGELRSLNDHLKKCIYHAVECTNKCGRTVQRKKLEEHLKNDCPNRLQECPHCHEVGELSYINSDHLQVCPDFHLTCPIRGCTLKVRRCQMEMHRSTCPKKSTQCLFANVGCDFKLKREDCPTHCEEYMSYHLQLAVKAIGEQQKTIDDQKKILAEQQMKMSEQERALIKQKRELIEQKIAVEELRRALSNMATLTKMALRQKDIATLTLTVLKFEEMRQCSGAWCSLGFYTHITRGYKMCLYVYVNGVGKAKGTHLSCFIHLMKGDFDHQLEWPFRGAISVTLLNQLEDKHHCEEIIQFQSRQQEGYNSRVMQGTYSTGWGKVDMIAHSDLYFKPKLNQQYLKGDCLHVRIAVIRVDSFRSWLS